MIVAIMLLISISACIITFLVLKGDKEVNAKSKVIFLDLASKGNATLVQSVDNKGNHIYGMIDGGKPINYLDDIEPYLVENNINRLDFLIVTHMDVDHVGGIQELLDSEYVDKDTTLYMKITSKSKGLYTAVKNKEMNIAVVEPITAPENKRTNKEVMSAPDSDFQTKINYYSKADDYTNATESENFSFGEFTIIIYNGVDWNSQDVVDEDWDENVNSLTCLLERNNSKNELQRIYIGSDLGENSAEDSSEDHVQYSIVIGERISQIVGQVDVYLVACLL
jgi:phosphoribosyl 1,2-cyclic phosphodiesterase